MYEWLENELRGINTRKFFLIDGPASSSLRKAIESSPLPMPTSYRDYCLRFGNSSFFRMGLHRYEITVYASPRYSDDQARCYVGRYSGAHVFLLASTLSGDHECPVFEWYGKGGTREIARSFHDWLKKRFKSCRRKVRTKDWAAIKRGPSPFSEEELKIIKARNMYKWIVAGVSRQGDLQFRISNKSELALPFLSLGIRSKGSDGSTFLGGIYLPVSNVKPGKHVTVVQDCYKDIIDPHKVVPYLEPDPEPEDREYYWEFGH